MKSVSGVSRLQLAAGGARRAAQRLWEAAAGSLDLEEAEKMVGELEDAAHWCRRVLNSLHAARLYEARLSGDRDSSFGN